MTQMRPARTLDFTSALYLGLRHSSWTLRPWPQLSTGAPAALRESPAASSVAGELASLMGCERATLGPSTLHLFWDLFQDLAGPDSIIYVDAGLYPIARWGVERAAALGIPVESFPHHEPDALRRRLARESGHRPPLIVTDGFCPRCGRPAPLAAYVEAARRWDGCVVLDDTQALGVLGRDPGPRAPYGHGGGGSLRLSALEGPDLIVVASLAKGLGVPLAVLAGSRECVSHFEASSETRVHCSPPSVATLHAAEHALAVNRKHGDALRARLAGLVSLARRRLSRSGVSLAGGMFPVQTLATAHGDAAQRIHHALTRRRVLTVLRRSARDSGARLTFLLTARHTSLDIVELVEALTRIAEAVAIPLEVDHDGAPASLR
jgi:8-amino-7-oxononanoate synthase